MCLYNKPKKVSQFLNKKRGTSFLKCYKVVELTNRRNQLRSYHYKKVWHFGWNSSTSKRKGPCYKEEAITCGIHVYTNKKKAVWHLHLCGHCSISKLLEVYCKATDLLGVGDNYTAVFRKVYVTKKSFNRARS